MKLTFDIAFNRLMDHEGEYTDGAGDPGGETKWGISKRSYPDLDIKNLDRADARNIYLHDFWEKIHAYEMYDGVAYQTFDFAVNSGISTAIRYLQRAVNVADDGYWGPASRAAVAAMPEWRVIMRLNSLRLNYDTRLKNWPQAGKGWSRRIAENLWFGGDDSLD